MAVDRKDEAPTAQGSGFERFHATVLNDPELQERLRVLSDWPAFARAAADAAAERGIELSVDELETAREEARRAWFERWI